MAQQVDIASDMTTAYEQAQAFLDPVLSGAASEDGHWEAASQRWVAPERDDDD